MLIIKIFIDKLHLLIITPRKYLKFADVPRNVLKQTFVLGCCHSVIPLVVLGNNNDDVILVVGSFIVRCHLVVVGFELQFLLKPGSDFADIFGCVAKSLHGDDFVMELLFLLDDIIESTIHLGKGYVFIEVDVSVAPPSVEEHRWACIFNAGSEFEHFFDLL